MTHTSVDLKNVMYTMCTTFGSMTTMICIEIHVL